MFEDKPSLSSKENESPPKEKSFLVPRSSYTLNNALRFQRFFDLAISTKKNVSIPLKPKNDPDYLAPSTIKNRMSDALKWLSDNNLKDFQTNAPFEQKDYIELKNSVVVAERFDCIEITFGSNRRRTKMSAYEPTVSDSNAKAQILDNLKDEIMNYLQDEKQTGVFYRDGLSLNEEFTTWFRRICAGMVFDITNNKLTIVK